MAKYGCIMDFVLSGSEYVLPWSCDRPEYCTSTSVILPLVPLWARWIQYTHSHSVSKVTTRNET